MKKDEGIGEKEQRKGEPQEKIKGESRMDGWRKTLRKEGRKQGGRESFI